MDFSHINAGEVIEAVDMLEVGKVTCEAVGMGPGVGKDICEVAGVAGANLGPDVGDDQSDLAGKIRGASQVDVVGEVCGARENIDEFQGQYLNVGESIVEISGSMRDKVAGKSSGLSAAEDVVEIVSEAPGFGEVASHGERSSGLKAMRSRLN